MFAKETSPPRHLQSLQVFSTHRKFSAKRNPELLLSLPGGYTVCLVWFERQLG